MDAAPLLLANSPQKGQKLLSSGKRSLAGRPGDSGSRKRLHYHIPPNGCRPWSQGPRGYSTGHPGHLGIKQLYDAHLKIGGEHLYNWF